MNKPFQFLCWSISNSLQKEDAAVAQLILTAMMARIIDDIDDAFWIDMKIQSAVPCENEGCDCELARSKVFEALDFLREHYRENCRE